MIQRTKGPGKGSGERLLIGALARGADVSPEAIRYYERIGVLEPPPRDEQGRRVYGLRVLDELRLLKAAQSVGFSLEEIARLLALTREESVPCRPMCALMEQRMQELDRQIRELRAARARLAGALEDCDPEERCVMTERFAFEPA